MCSVELFDHLYISRRNRQNDRFRVYHFIRGSFFTNTIIYDYSFNGSYIGVPKKGDRFSKLKTISED